MQPLIVLKLGGSVLADESSLPLAVHEVARWRREGFGVVAVVSALAGETETLLARAAEAGDGHATAALASLGEQRAAALLGVQLARSGVPARVLQPAALRWRAEGDPLDATPVALDCRPLRRALAEGEVVVVPGFFAHDGAGRAVLFGRGGTDLSALFLAARLGARCRLVKDVDGLFTSDPAAPGPPPARFAEATWADALATDGSIVQHKAVTFARARGQPFEVARLGGAVASLVGAPRTRLAAALPTRPPLRVALLGLGTVGGGVLAALRRLPEQFEVVAACVRDPRPARRAPLPGLALDEDPVRTATRGADVVVEALGGEDPARAALLAALRAGSHVVSANKAVLAAHGAELEREARRAGRSLRASAAAGGAMPLLPVLRRLAREERVLGLQAVLNGTSTFVLDALAGGATPDEALDRAREAGFCERDCARDLSGRDAADKLVLACHAATGLWLDPRAVACEPIGERELRDAQAGILVRQVATLELGRRPVARVRPERLPAESSLARTRGCGNAARIGSELGVTELAGRGAGRWPTVEGVMGDLLELAREESQSSGCTATTPFVQVQPCGPAGSTIHVCSQMDVPAGKPGGQ